MKAQAPRYFNKKLGVGILFLPLSVIFWIGSKFSKLFSYSYRAKAKVVCIGNVVVGGVGKTPLVIRVVEHYLKLGIRVAVISRGYGSNRDNIGRITSVDIPTFVDIKKDTAMNVGDEPLMIARHFNGDVPVCVCRNRGVALQCLDAMGVDVVVADDGLQNYTFRKNKVVVAFDGKDGIGNGWILPAGPMRETLSSGMEKADVVMMIRQKNSKLEAKLKKYGKPIFFAEPVVKGGNEFDGKKVVAFAGIGKPEKFYKSLKGCGAEIVATFDFPDHHYYREAEILHLIDVAKRHGAMLVTTEKDLVKIPVKLAGEISVLSIDMKIERESAFFKVLDI